MATETVFSTPLGQYQFTPKYDWELLQKLEDINKSLDEIKQLLRELKNGR